MKWRKSLYDIIEVADEQNTLSKLYDWMMMIVIVVSIPFRWLRLDMGDIYAVSTIGKVITMLSSIFGIAIVALPAGIVTAGYMEEINKGESR